MSPTRNMARISTIVDPGKLGDDYCSFLLHSLHRKSGSFPKGFHSNQKRFGIGRKCSLCYGAALPQPNVEHPKRTAQKTRTFGFINSFDISKPEFIKKQN